MIIKDELLGRTIKVVQATNGSLVGLQGQVIDETRHTLRIRTMRGEKTLLKEQVTLRVDEYLVDGKLLLGRSEQRTKNKATTWQRKKPR